MQRFWQPPILQSLQGAHVSLLALDPQRDANALFDISHGTPEKEAVWRFLFYGPFLDSSAMKAWMQNDMIGKPDLLTWTVFDSHAQQQVGMVSLLSMQPQHGRAEIGHVWFGAAAHRTKINTETQYLLLRYLFDDLNYRRVEWKCDSQNHASRTTASRLGFIFEGRFRQHMMIKGRNRDTDWFAMTDKDWPRCKANFETWLAADGGVSLAALNNG